MRGKAAAPVCDNEQSAELAGAHASIISAMGVKVLTALPRARPTHLRGVGRGTEHIKQEKGLLRNRAVQQHAGGRREISGRQRPIAAPVAGAEECLGKRPRRSGRKREHESCCVEQATAALLALSGKNARKEALLGWS